MSKKLSNTDIADLEKLSELKERGVLTKEEFESKKNAIIGTTKDVTAQNIKSLHKLLIIGFIIWLSFSVITYIVKDFYRITGRSATFGEQSSQQDLLELISYRCYEEYGYFTITGEVKNISNKALRNVAVVGSSYSDGGKFINSTEALISYNPILGGQTSSFTAMMTMNPAMSKCKVSFKDLLGGSIKTKI